MKITEDVRRYAEEHGHKTADAIETGLREQAGTFREQGGDLYVAAKPAGGRP
jgi:phosphomethylpyrimidine synthase